MTLNSRDHGLVHTRLLTFLLFLVLLLIIPSVALAETRYVATTGSDTIDSKDNDCTDCITPCLTIQQAVDQAGAGDEIRVAGGTYTDTVTRTFPAAYPISPTNSITQVVCVSETVTIRGGYSPGFTETNPISYTTILDGEGEKRVVFVGGNITPTLESLRITGGNATVPIESDVPEPIQNHPMAILIVSAWEMLIGGGSFGLGGGIYVLTATTTISNCAIYSNTANIGDSGGFGAGGGVAVGGSDYTTIMASDVYSNVANEMEEVQQEAEGYGGGVYVGGSNATTLSDNAIYSNTADVSELGSGMGGGIYIEESENSTLTANAIYGNVGGDDGGPGGGGGVCIVTGTTTLTGNDIYSNTAGTGNSSGGGISISNAYTTTLAANTIYANDSGYFGGLMIMDVEPLTLTNNLIAANHADEGGSGVYVMDSTGYLLHNTIANNTGGGEEGVLVDGVTNGNCTLTFTNTIVSSHTVGITTTAGSTVTLDSALWYNNGTNIDGAGSITTKNDYEGDPDFVNPAGGNYHIGAGSAALDKGVGTWVSEDIDGDARPQGEAPDLGADERLAARPVGGASVPGRPLRVLLPWAGLAVFATFLLAGGTVAHVRR